MGQSSTGSSTGCMTMELVHRYGRFDFPPGSASFSLIAYSSDSRAHALMRFGQAPGARIRYSAPEALLSGRMPPGGA